MASAKLMMTMGSKIKQLRKQRGWTHAALMRESGIDLTTISRLENGHVRNPELRTLAKLAKAFGTSVDAFSTAADGAIDAMSSKQRQDSRERVLSLERQLLAELARADDDPSHRDRILELEIALGQAAAEISPPKPVRKQR